MNTQTKQAHTPGPDAAEMLEALEEAKKMLFDVEVMLRVINVGRDSKNKLTPKAISTINETWGKLPSVNKTVKDAIKKAKGL